MYLFLYYREWEKDVKKKVDGSRASSKVGILLDLSAWCPRFAPFVGANLGILLLWTREV
jgi:hypothetical protein